MDRKGVQELDEDILFPVETEITQSGTEELVIVPSVASNNRFEVVHNGPHCTSAVPRLIEIGGCAVGDIAEDWHFSTFARPKLAFRGVPQKSHQRLPWRGGKDQHFI